MKSGFRRIAAAVAMLAAVGLSPATAWAGDHGGSGRLEAVDVDARTVTVDGRVMPLAANAKLLGKDGRQITLTSLLPVLNEPIPTVKYYGEATGEKLVIHKLRVVEFHPISG